MRWFGYLILAACVTVASIFQFRTHRFHAGAALEAWPPAMGGHVIPELRLDRVPVEAVIDRLAKEAGCPVAVDWGSLDEVGVGRTTPITMLLYDSTPAVALRAVALKLAQDRDAPVRCVAVGGGFKIVARPAVDDGSLQVGEYDIQELLSMLPRVEPYRPHMVFAGSFAPDRLYEYGDWMRDRMEDLDTIVREGAGDPPGMYVDQWAGRMWIIATPRAQAGIAEWVGKMKWMQKESRGHPESQVSFGVSDDADK